METFDPQAQAEKLKRRRALAEALMAQNMQTPINAGGNLGHGAVQGIAKVLGAILGQRQLKGLDKEEADLSAKRAAGLQTELQNYMTTREGRPGEVMTEGQVAELMQNNVAPQLAEPVKADPRKAVIQAMISRYPEMQAVGATDMASLAKQKPYEEHVIDGKIVRSAPGGQTAVLGDFKDRDEWSEPYDMTVDGKTIKVRRHTKTNKVEAIGQGGNNVSINMGDKGDLSFMGEVDKAIAPGGKRYEKAVASANSMALTNQALGAIQQGASSGTAEPIIQTIRGLGERVGIENAATAPTDTLGAALKDRTFNRLGGLGAQVSDADRSFVEAASGSLSTNPKALKVILAYQTAADMIEVQRHNKTVDQRAAMSQNPDMFGAAKVNFDVNFSDPEFADMVQRVLQGKPAIGGGPAPAVVPGASPTQAAPATPRGAPLDPRIKWSDLTGGN